MLQTIRPSEMCGMSQPLEAYQQAERVEVRRASAVRISAHALPSRPSSEYYPKAQLQSKTSPTADVFAIAPSSEDVPPVPQHNDLSANSRPYSSIPGGPQIATARGSVRRKREGVLSFLVRRDSTASSSTQFSREEQDVHPDIAYRRNASTEKAPQEPRVRREEYAKGSAGAASKKRLQHRPTMSCFTDGPHEAKLTVGSLSSRPVSIAAQRPLVSKWTPSSSSSEGTRSARTESPPLPVPAPLPDRVVSNDEESVADLSFLNDFKRSEVAAYLASAQDEPAEQKTPTLASFSQSLATPDGQGTFWFTDTDSDATKDDAPDASFWDNTKIARTTVIAKPIESSDDDNWPLPNARSDFSMPFASQGTELDATRTISHTSNLSRGTISSTSTIISPTFSHRRSESTAASTVHSPSAQPAQAVLTKTQLDDTASIAPSEVSVQWTRSPKERLGLGGVVRKTEILPWEDSTRSPTRRLRKSSDLVRARSVSDRFSAFMNWRDRNFG